MKISRPIIALTFAGAILAAVLGLLHNRSDSNQPEPDKAEATPATASAEPQSSSRTIPTARPPRPSSPSGPTARSAADPAVETPMPTNKVERLARIRESFHALAAGDPATAMRAAKDLKDPTEREAALLTLVTEWTQGQLRSPRDRATAIGEYGLEVGIGFELAAKPELAMLWANELTDSAGRTAILSQVAAAMVGSDPANALALSDQVPPENRRKFLDFLYAQWAQKDTDAALQWADQLTDPAERSAANDAIHAVAPIGIGAAMRLDNGYPVITQLMPGSAADLSGQLHPGDRIVAVTGVDQSFVDVHNASLADVVQLIRGAPDTRVQLQIIPANAPADSPPQIVAITRSQIKYKSAN